LALPTAHHFQLRLCPLLGHSELLLGFRLLVLGQFHRHGKPLFTLLFALPLINFPTQQHIYYVIKKHHHPNNYLDDIFVHLPFSLYHGWTTFLTVLAAFAAFGVNAATHPAGFWTKLFVVLALLFLKSTAAAYSLSTPKGDLPGSIAITWVLFAIFAHQTVPFIHWSALAFAILSLIWVGKAIFGLYKTGRISLPGEESV
jgi:hypothetical protein